MLRSTSQSPRKSSSHKNTLSLVDLWLRNEEKEKIGQVLKKKFTVTDRRSSSSYGKYQDKYPKYKDKYSKSKKALVKIQEGCDNFCAYCIVSYVRGRSKSRYLDEILKEVKELVKDGIEEIILTGIDISSYNFQFSILNSQSIFKSQFSNYKNDLVQLIKVILKETKIKKISFGSMGLGVFDEEFSKLYSENKLRSGEAMKQYNNKLSSHFHIPLQSGSDTVLKRMKRNYTVKKFIDIIKKLNKNIPGFSFSTDIIVGFPGETKKEFEETVRVIREIREILGKRFKKIHVFRYSGKKGTLAEKMLGKPKWEAVDEKEKRSRAKALNNFNNSIIQ